MLWVEGRGSVQVTREGSVEAEPSDVGWLIPLYVRHGSGLGYGLT